MARHCIRCACTLFVALVLTACGGGTSVEFDTDDGGSVPPFLAPDWVTQEGESGTDAWAKNVAALPTSADAIVAGGFIDGVTFDPGGGNETDLTGTGDLDAFVGRYDTDGDLVWVKPILSDAYVDLGEIATTSDDEITVVGYFDGTVTLGDGTSEEISYDVSMYEDSFIARYDEDGVLQWSVHVESDDFVETLAVAGFSDDGVVVGGLFAGSMTLDEGGPNEVTFTSEGSLDAFLAVYDKDGDFVGALHSVPDAAGDWVTIWSIDVSDDDVIAVTGDFAGTVTVESSDVNSVDIASVNDSRDGYVAVYNSDVELDWVRTFGGDEGDTVYAVNIAPDSGAVRVAGDFRDTATWTSTTAASEVELTSEGEIDASVASYDGDGLLEWVRQVGGLEDDFGYDVLVNDDGETILIGWFTDEATFSGGGNEDSITTDGTNDADGFISAYSSVGELAWLRTLGGTGDDYAVAMELVPGTNDDVYTVGSFTGTAYLWHDASSHTARGTRDVFVSMLVP